MQREDIGTNMTPDTNIEVARLTKRMQEAETLIKRGHDGWKKAEAEVARLRELLNRALECLKVYGGILGVDAAKQISEELAPAPEEPTKN